MLSMSASCRRKIEEVRVAQIVKDYPNYSITQDGKVTRLGFRGGVLKPSLTPAGYVKYGLCKNGEDLHNAKLRNEDIPDIFSLHQSGYSQAEIARKYGVTRQAIWYVLHLKTYRRA